MVNTGRRLKSRHYFDLCKNREALAMQDKILIVDDEADIVEGEAALL